MRYRLAALLVGLFLGVICLVLTGITLLGVAGGEHTETKAAVVVFAGLSVCGLITRTVYQWIKPHPTDPLQSTIHDLWNQSRHDTDFSSQLPSRKVRRQ
jgi:hypothetical protein